MSVPEGQTDCEIASCSQRAFYRNRASVHLDQFAHQGEANTASLVAAPAHAVDAPEPLEKVRQVNLRDAGPGIDDRKQRLAVCRSHRYPDLSLEGGLERVGEQVDRKSTRLNSSH